MISLYTLVPFIVFFNLARVHIDANLGGGLVIGWVAILSAAGLAWFAGSRLLRLSRPSTGSLIVGTLVPNSGYLGYPLVASLLGFHALGHAVVYDIAVPAPSLLLLGFGTGAAFGTRAGEGFRDRIVAFFTRNPPLYAAVAALLVPGQPGAGRARRCLSRRGDRPAAHRVLCGGRRARGGGRGEARRDRVAASTPQWLPRSRFGW